MVYKLDPKDPDAFIDYNIDWSKWLDAVTGDIITNSVWIVPVGLTKDNDSFTNSQTTVWLSGGVLGVTYNLVNRITTANGRIQDQTIQILVKHL